MPRIEVVFFRDSAGRSPVLAWMEDLQRRDRRGFAKCVAVLDRLETFGHELRRPTADFLRDGIHELRVRAGNVNYRLLYFFHGRERAVVAHALTKLDVVPDADIERALRRKSAFESNPLGHTHRE